MLWEVPPTARKPDAVLHRCIPDGEQLAAEHVLIAAEVLSTWSGRRDRVHKMSDYADAGIPHYWLVGFDKVGAVTIERYALAVGPGRYVHVGTSHRDMGPIAFNISAPFPVEILWADLEVAPRVLSNRGRRSGDQDDCLDNTRNDKVGDRPSRLSHPVGRDQGIDTCLRRSRPLASR